MAFFDPLFNLINDLTWGWAMVPILVVFGGFFTIASGFIQFRFFRRMFGVLTGDDESSDPSKISAREALFVSVGGRVGGGNIAGVAVASIAIERLLEVARRCVELTAALASTAQARECTRIVGRRDARDPVGPRHPAFVPGG